MNHPAQSQKKSMMISNQKTVVGLLEQMKTEIARCLPKHLTPERMTRIALTELRKSPKLQECDPMSFIAAIMQASQLGLEPGILGSCYLIPFNNTKLGKVECTFMPGYRGFLDLARRSGQIVSLVARAVYENDIFTYEFGLEEVLKHKPAMDDKGALVAVYAVAILKDGGHQFDVMSKKDVDQIRNQSKSKDSGPWVTHYEEMAKKTVLRKLFKWLPCSVEMQKAVSLDELQEAGLQNIKAAASEEFDVNFFNENGEPTGHAQKKHDVLLDKLKSAKSQSIEDEIIPVDSKGFITKEQLDELDGLLLVKDYDKAMYQTTMDQYKIQKNMDLTREQAQLLIDALRKCADKE